jgi:hypothetical protein
VARPRDLLPSDLLRTLSSHGPVQVVLGETTATVPCAPFEDAIYLFVRPDTEAEKALTGQTRASLRASAQDRSYSIALKGRARLGRRVNRSPRRSELLPWLPEGSAPSGWVALPFFAEEVEYLRGAERFHGQTAAMDERAGVWATWAQVLLPGAWPQMVIGCAVTWGYLLWQGNEFPLRWAALVVGLLAVVLLLAGAQAWLRVKLFERWLAGAPVTPPEHLFRGLVAPAPLLGLSAGLTMVGGLALASLGVWGLDVVGLAFGASLIWLQWPLNLTRVYTGDTDEEERE